MAGIAPAGGGPRIKGGDAQHQNYTSALAVLTSLFFIWAFVTNLNDILIPKLKRTLDLTDFQSSLVQFAFFGAYFIMSLPSGWVVKKLGYKKGILVGLAVMLGGALLFVPAALVREYSVFLLALFILASGVTLLQVAANPFVAVLGPPERSSTRLNLTQAFNSLGATLGPLVGGLLILSAHEMTDAELLAMTPEALEAFRTAEAHSVIWPYIGLAGILFLITLLIYFSRLPEIDDELEAEEPEFASHVDHKRRSVWEYPHLVSGVIAIFFYVGAEVAIASFLIRFAGLENIASLSEKDASKFPAGYMFFAMIGRFAGSWLLTKIAPNRVLAFNSLAAMVLVVIAVLSNGYFALGMLVLVGLFNSIMFPTIFTLAIRDLGEFTKRGSSLLIMAIVGGALIPPATGLVSDVVGIQQAFLVPGLCYLAILYFGWRGYRVPVDK